MIGRTSNGLGVQPGDGRRRLLGGAATLALVAALAGVLIGYTGIAQARQPTEFEKFAIESTLASTTSSVAGGHPDLATEFALTHEEEELFPGLSLSLSYGRTENVEVALPPGLVGNPNNVTKCSTGQLIAPLGSCPTSSQVGTVLVRVSESERAFLEPLYNMEAPRPNMVARLGFIAEYYPTFIDIGVRTDSDYGLTATVSGASGQGPLISARTTLWGVPAAADHDQQRLTSEEALNCIETACEAPEERRSSGLTPKPFFTWSSDCGTAQSVLFNITSYQLPGRIFSQSTPLEAASECSRQTFSPTLSLETSDHERGAPTGLTATVTIPQAETVAGPATPPMKSATVTLPEGMTISPAAGAGLESCDDQQIALGTESEANCPLGAKLGSARFVSPALPTPVEGAIYQREPLKGNLFRIWLVAEAYGMHLKIPGQIHADAATGQVSAHFEDLPQLPVETITLAFKGGPTAPLANPTSCGSYGASWEMASWSGGEAATGEQQIAVDEGCSASGFEPRFEVGTTNPVAGFYAPLELHLTRSDGEQNVERLSATLPPGLLAKLAGVPLCPDSAAPSGTCPGGSRIGSVSLTVGSGTQPLRVPQPGKEPTAVYLAGPYRGAPYSLVVKVPAQAGPFDLGTVAVRTALQVNPQTTQVTAESDPLPQILEGVPIVYRSIDVVVDRPEFALNPTDCEPLASRAEVQSSAGLISHPVSRFQVGDCGALAFEPKLKLSLSGQTKRAGNPALRAVLTQPAGSNANIAGTSAILPKGTFIDQSHVSSPCTRVQFSENNCPAKSVLGTAKAWSPLLERPLEGPVYFRSNGGERQLPDLVADLNGQIHVILVGFIDSVKKKGSESSRVRTRFQSVPDAPVSRFELKLFGGKRGLIENSQNLCQINRPASLFLTGQNGKTYDTESKVQVTCGRRAKSGKGKKSDRTR